MSDALVGVNATFLGAWTALLKPVRSTLTPRLASIFKDAHRSESERGLATNVLTDYASDDPNLLADLLMVADPKAYQKLFPVVEEQRAHTVLPVPGGDPKEGESRGERGGQGQTCRATGASRGGTGQVRESR